MPKRKRTDMGSRNNKVQKLDTIFSSHFQPVDMRQFTTNFSESRIFKSDFRLFTNSLVPTLSLAFLAGKPGKSGFRKNWRNHKCTENKDCSGLFWPWLLRDYPHLEGFRCRSLYTLYEMDSFEITEGQSDSVKDLLTREQKSLVEITKILNRQSSEIHLEAYFLAYCRFIMSLKDTQRTDALGYGSICLTLQNFERKRGTFYLAQSERSQDKLTQVNEAAKRQLKRDLKNFGQFEASRGTDVFEVLCNNFIRNDFNDVVFGEVPSWYSGTVREYSEQDCESEVTSWQKVTPLVPISILGKNHKKFFF